MTHNEMRDWIGKAMQEKGFWDDGTGPLDGLLLRLSLAQTETCEAMQEVKRHWGKVGVGTDGLKDKVAEELADKAIRVYDCAAFGEINLDGCNNLYDPLDCGPDERVRIIIRCGKVTSLIGSVFRLVEPYVEDGLDGVILVRNMKLGEFLYTAIRHLEYLCLLIGRDLYAAIGKKMVANMARPRKYGTPDEGKAAV